MNTIKIPVKVTTVEETFVEVELPCYTRVHNDCYRVESEPMCYSVWIMGDSAVIAKVMVQNAFETGYELITKEEYEEQFEKALSILKGKQL